MPNGKMSGRSPRLAASVPGPACGPDGVGSRRASFAVLRLRRRSITVTWAGQNGIRHGCQLHGRSDGRRPPPPGAGWLRGFGAAARRMAHSVRSRFSAPAFAFATMPWNIRPPWSGNAPDPWSTPRPARSPPARAPWPGRPRPTAARTRRGRAAANPPRPPLPAKSGSAGADRAATEVPAAPARPDAASAPCPSPSAPAAPVPEMTKRLGPPACYTACWQLPYPVQDQGLVCPVSWSLPLA